MWQQAFRRCVRCHFRIIEKFGTERVIDTPITEFCNYWRCWWCCSNWFEASAELMFIDFLGVSRPAYEPIAKFRYVLGNVTTPVTIRTMIGAGAGTGLSIHKFYPLLVSSNGIKVVAPSNAYDAGFYRQAIRDDTRCFLRAQGYLRRGCWGVRWGICNSFWPEVCEEIT